MSFKAVVFFVGVLCCTLAAKADLTGTSVTGSAQFMGGSANVFDPMYGYVPANYGNAAGTTVKIGSGIEFGLEDSLNRDTANFMANTLTIKDVCKVSDCGDLNFSALYTFTDAAFSGLTINFLSNGLGLSATHRRGCAEPDAKGGCAAQWHTVFGSEFQPGRCVHSLNLQAWRCWERACWG